MNDEPRDMERDLVAENLPILNRPATHVSFTGYRDHVQEDGRTNDVHAIEFINNLTSIPHNAEGKIDPELLDVDWDGKGCVPSFNLIRGMMELLTSSFLQNTYPEWIGDAVDDSTACLDVLSYVASIKEYGWEHFLTYIVSDDAPPSWMIPEKIAQLFELSDDD